MLTFRIVGRQPSLRLLLKEDRLALTVMAVGATVASVAWGATTRPMGDSESYRISGQVIFNGWHQITDRTPGYPVLLWLTNSLHAESHLLFLVQLTMHLCSVILVLLIARSLGLSKFARLVITVLAVLPPPMVKVVYSGSEALTELLVVLAVWLFTRWYDARSAGTSSTMTLVWLGIVVGALSWVRPTFQLFWLPVAALVWLIAARPDGWFRFKNTGAAVRSAFVVAAPAALIAVCLIAINGIRFGQWLATPMTGWFLGSRTSAYIQELPQSEPLRGLLIEERDRRMLLGPETDAENYMFGIRDELSARTGLSGADLDERILQLNLGLIASHPFSYIAQVNESLLNLTQIDAEPAASGPGRLGGWLQSATHLALMAGFALTLVTLPGLILAGLVERRTVVILAFAMMAAAYVVLVSALIETGSPRLRAPTDLLLLLVMVSGWKLLTNRVQATDRLRV